MTPNAGALNVSGDPPAHAKSSAVNTQLLYEQPPPGPSLGERHTTSKNDTPLTEEQKAECAKSLRSSTLFKYCSDESILKVTEQMRREEFSEGEVFCICLDDRGFKHASNFSDYWSPIVIVRQRDTNLFLSSSRWAL